MEIKRKRGNGCVYSGGGFHLSNQLKWDYVREMIKKEEDESFIFRKNRDLKSPVTSQTEMIKIKISDMSFDILRLGALIVFAENIDPLNVNRLNRRIVEKLETVVVEEKKKSDELTQRHSHMIPAS